MRLSFVIPAYNEEAYLAECIDSILAQSCNLGHDVEVIVVNNASSDGTRAVAQRYAGVVLVDEPRKGLCFARQAGLAVSTGDLVANVDADSRLTDGWIEQVLETFAAEPELVALSGPVVYYDLAPRQRVMVRFFYMTAWLAYVCNRYVLRVGSMVQGGNFVVSRTAMERIGGFNVAITFYGEDTDIATRLNRVGKVHFTFALKMFSSARRLKHEGMMTMAARYSINYLWTTFLKRPFTQEHIDIREPLEQ